MTTLRHGRTGSSIHRTWKGMRQRCENPNNHRYSSYGGRGIAVCERWQTFENFLADMGECPSGKSLERKNNNEGYSPSNCVWATRAEQARNTRTTVFLEYNGERLCLRDWEKRAGLPYGVLSHRVKLNWPQSRLFSPAKKRRTKAEMLAAGLTQEAL